MEQAGIAAAWLEKMMWAAMVAVAPGLGSGFRWTACLGLVLKGHLRKAPLCCGITRINHETNVCVCVECLIRKGRQFLHALLAKQSGALEKGFPYLKFGTKDTKLPKGPLELFVGHQSFGDLVWAGLSGLRLCPDSELSTRTCSHNLGGLGLLPRGLDRKPSFACRMGSHADARSGK